MRQFPASQLATLACVALAGCAPLATNDSAADKNRDAPAAAQAFARNGCQRVGDQRDAAGHGERDAGDTGLIVRGAQR